MPLPVGHVHQHHRIVHVRVVEITHAVVVGPRASVLGDGGMHGRALAVADEEDDLDQLAGSTWFGRSAGGSTWFRGTWFFG